MYQQSVAQYFKKHDYCWSKGLEHYSKDLVTEETASTLKKDLSVENLKASKKEFFVNYQKKAKHGLNYREVQVWFVPKNNGSRVAIVGTRNVDDTVMHEKKAAYKTSDDCSGSGNCLSSHRRSESFQKSKLPVIIF